MVVFEGACVAARVMIMVAESSENEANSLERVVTRCNEEIGNEVSGEDADDG